MLIFASTNDSVQFHENILRTFVNRKFSLYLENSGGGGGSGDGEEIDLDDIDDDFDEDEFIADADGDGFELNLKKNGLKKNKPKVMNKKEKKKLAAQKKKKKKQTIDDTTGKNLIDVFALYGNMDQHRRAEILAKYCKSDSGLLICTVRAKFVFYYIFYSFYSLLCI